MRLNISFFAINLILLFAVISFILVVFDLHRFAFVLELGMLLVLLFFLAFAVFAMYNNKKWGWTLTGAVLLVLLLNTFFVYMLTKTFDTAYATATVFSIAGLALAVFSLRGSGLRAIRIEGEKPQDYYPYIDKMEPESEAKEPNIEKTFTPGKFVASKKASKFHAAKCDWAKRIGKSNQVWFNSREEAESKGFEADTCIS